MTHRRASEVKSEFIRTKRAEQRNLTFVLMVNRQTMDLSSRKSS